TQRTGERHSRGGSERPVCLAGRSHDRGGVLAPSTAKSTIAPGDPSRERRTGLRPHAHLGAHPGQDGGHSRHGGGQTTVRPCCTARPLSLRRAQAPRVMKRIFADTLSWIAITNRKDQWHPAAAKASRDLGGCHLVTTEEVLAEVLNAFCEAGRVLR